MHQTIFNFRIASLQFPKKSVHFLTFRLFICRTGVFHGRNLMLPDIALYGTFRNVKERTDNADLTILVFRTGCVGVKSALIDSESIRVDR